MTCENTQEYVKSVLQQKMKHFQNNRMMYSREDRKILCVDIFDFCLKNYNTIKETFPKSFHKIISERLRRFREEDCFMKDGKYDILLTLY